MTFVPYTFPSRKYDLMLKAGGGERARVSPNSKLKCGILETYRVAGSDRSRSSHAVDILVGEFLRARVRPKGARTAVVAVQSSIYMHLDKLHPSVGCSPVDALARS